MTQEYIVKDSFYVSKKPKTQVLVLDHQRELQKSDSLEFLIEGRSVPFLLTHNDFWIIVEDDADYKNKKIVIN